MDAGESSLGSFYTIASQGLTDSGKIAYTGTPDNIKETLPDGSNVVPRLKNRRRSLGQDQNMTTDLVLFERGLRLQKRGFMDIFGGFVHKIVGAVIGSFCKPCGQVYGYITDPLSLVADVCQPCKPVIDFHGRITDPLGAAFDAIRYVQRTHARIRPTDSSQRTLGKWYAREEKQCPASSRIAFQRWKLRPSSPETIIL